MSRVRENTINTITEVAADLFLENTIASVTMEEIAKKAGVGPASLYRYFGTKQTIVMKTAVLLAERIQSEYFTVDAEKTGFEQIKDFYLQYLRIFKEKKEYFRFIKEFDAQFVSEKSDDKEQYEYQIEGFYRKFREIYEKGISDGSISETEDVKLFYYSTAHAIMNLCKALSSDNVLISQDESIKAEDEIRQLTEIILFRLKK